MFPVLCSARPAFLWCPQHISWTDRVTTDSCVVLLSQSWTNQFHTRGSHCCFLNHIQVSQETGKMVWYSHLSKSFTQFVMIHTVKGFSVVDEKEIDVLLKFPYFLYNSVNVGSLISSSSSFSKPSLDIWKFLVHIMLKLSMQDFKHVLTSMGDWASVWWLAHSLVLSFLAIMMKIDLFQPCGHCWVFQICWYKECKTLLASSFRSLNCSSGISLHPLALLTALLLKAHLTLNSRMSGSRSLTTPS